MDLQKMLDIFAEEDMKTRGKYHMTLGGLIQKLYAIENKSKGVFIEDTPTSVYKPHSYRGYYSDLALEPTETAATSVESLLQMLTETLDTIKTGYKGGEFNMHKDVPIWVSEYGRASGLALVDLSEFDKEVRLRIKTTE